PDRSLRPEVAVRRGEERALVAAIEGDDVVSEARRRVAELPPEQRSDEELAVVDLRHAHERRDALVDRPRSDLVIGLARGLRLRRYRRAPSRVEAGEPVTQRHG